MKRFYAIIRIALFCPIFILSGCLFDNENENWTETVVLTVASEIANYYPIEGIGVPIDGMRIKEEKTDYWKVVPLNSIEEFNYEVGYEYRLIVLKKYLAVPPADGSDVKYKLLETISKERKEIN
ncbi:MAG: hypothetical protein EZS26_002867 [Candidatus Ordinivivax streblomastigis]|uniref:DUF4377 domain-containing protein n=1 Tax=Candidatus Ordinivivax streblomastigis TaxID=2540710 RepID=A0A5M8NYL7_9BACT|nr:MAG: hypothetical protein EZS26_002867 [Candidatus Ordinivivax streblomastigis]